MEKCSQKDELDDNSQSPNERKIVFILNIKSKYSNHSLLAATNLLQTLF